MPDTLQAEVEHSGFAYVPGYLPSLTTFDAAETIGVPLTLPGFPTVQPLRPREREESTPNTYSGNFGRGEFPLHTDLAHWCLPPRYLALRCVAGVKGVATRVLDGHAVIASVGKAALERALVQPRRPLDNRRALLRLLDRCDVSAPLLRWDRLFIVPATATAEVTFDRLRVYTEFAEVIEVSLEKPGDTLVLDNWRTLHGRSAAGGDGPERHIERAYFDELT